MSRELYRVPLDFDYPLHKVWEGFVDTRVKPADWESWTGEEEDAWYESFVSTPPPEGEGYQVWETVSEGSPISPVFATAEEVVTWLTTVGDTVWGTYTEAGARKFVEQGRSMASFVMTGDGQMVNGIDALAVFDA